jgi:hypothetical protein
MLGRWPRPRAIKLFAANGDTLVLSEGIETGLAGATLSHRGALLRPVWALGSAGAIRRFPVLPGIKHLILLVDNDANSTGESSAAVCEERWIAAGRDVTQLITDECKDFNDLLMRRIS